MYQDARSTCRAIVIIITPFVFFKMSLTCRDNFVFVKNVMTFKTCPLVRIGPKVHAFLEIGFECYNVLLNCDYVNFDITYFRWDAVNRISRKRPKQTNTKKIK